METKSGVWQQLFPFFFVALLLPADNSFKRPHVLRYVKHLRIYKECKIWSIQGTGGNVNSFTPVKKDAGLLFRVASLCTVCFTSIKFPGLLYLARLCSQAEREIIRILTPLSFILHSMVKLVSVCNFFRVFNYFYNSNQFLQTRLDSAFFSEIQGSECRTRSQFQHGE